MCLGKSLDEGIGRRHRYRFDKQFHVSPFMDMNVDYDWRFSTPGAEDLAVHMENLRRRRTLFRCHDGPAPRGDDR
jgi:DUF1365 family protein